MKKFLIVTLSSAVLFASNLDEINQKLDKLLSIVIQLKKQSDSQDERIKKLERAVQLQQKEIKKQETTVKNQFAVKSCNKIKVTSFSDEYHGDIIPYYVLDFSLKNEYPKKIVYLEGNLFAEDKDGTVILQDFVKRKVDFPVGSEIKIHKKHLLNNDLENYLKDENPENLKVYFKVIKVEFEDGTNVECGL
jgi:hypothetical protein